MHLSRLQIRNFKGVDQLEISFLQEGSDQPRPLTLLLGANGSGKTTVLQAIALVLSLATRRTREASRLAWPGFLAERLSSRGSTRVELDVVFSDDELTLIQEAHRLWRASRSRPGDGERQDEIAETPPGRHPLVQIVYEDGRLDFPQGQDAQTQLLGRYLIREVLRTQPSHRWTFHRLGDVFWFDQNRNLGTLSSEGKPGIEGLRETLVGWWAVHTSPHRTPEGDYLGQVEERFKELWPGTRFGGVDIRPGSTSSSVGDMYFYIERGGLRYDLAEMSSGEQAIFPLLYEFARLSIARSVVLIDELELHLHPPQQQSLIAALRRIGPDCQFVVTSHSPYLEQVTPDEDEVRLPGAARCL